MAHVLYDRARAFCPGLRIDGMLHRTNKGVVLAGVLDGQDVVVKLLVDADPFWQDRFVAEISTYRALVLAPPLLPVPRLLAADPDAGVLVITRLPGAPVARTRYPRRLRAGGIAPLLQAARALRTWTAPRGMFAQVWAYPARFRRSRVEFHMLTDRDEAALNVLGRIPGAREQAEQINGGTVPQRAGFWANVATLLVRDLRTHHELPDGRLRTERLEYLRTALGTAQARVHELAGQL